MEIDIVIKLIGSGEVVELSGVAQRVQEIWDHYWLGNGNEVHGRKLNVVMQDLGPDYLERIGKIPPFNVAVFATITCESIFSDSAEVSGIMNLTDRGNGNARIEFTYSVSSSGVATMSNTKTRIVTDPIPIFYVPPHANGDTNHYASERGFVTSIREEDGVPTHYWCRFYNKTEDGLRTRLNSEMCPASSIVEREAGIAELSVIEDLLSKIWMTGGEL